MQITKFRHACLLVEDADARVLLDPGSYSVEFDGLTGLTAVLITHQHLDHVDPDRLRPVLERNPEAKVFADEDTVSKLATVGIEATAVHAGDTVDVGVEVKVFGKDHAVIHPDVPTVPNVGYLVGGGFFHPGDSFTVPDADVEVLGLPTAAPWLKVSEAVDYVRAVRPAVAVPIHEASLVTPAMVYARFEDLKPPGTALRVIDDGTPLNV